MCRFWNGHTHTCLCDLITKSWWCTSDHIMTSPLQHTASSCNTMQHTEYCNTVQRVAARCNIPNWDLSGCTIKRSPISCLVPRLWVRLVAVRVLGMKWCVAVWCVATCCSVLQCRAVCCSALQCVAVSCRALKCAAVCCSVLHCVTMCCACACCSLGVM